jgi:anion-transporting  ArsA/GET3 family ATPase
VAGDAFDGGAGFAGDARSPKGAASNAVTPPALLDRRLLVVTGKGGTGKSTVSAALALAASRKKKRVLVCEVTARERVSELFGRPPSGPQIHKLFEDVYSVHVRPPEAMREYGIMVLRSETLYNLVFERRWVRYFLNAAPSLAEIVMLGKVAWHAGREMEHGRPRWDLVVLDAPATGHGLTFLSVPEVFLSIVKEGPLARDMKFMDSMLKDADRTRTCIVTLPEEMPANEAIEMHRALAQRGFPQGVLFLNGVFAPSFAPEERVQVARGGPLLAAAADAADSHEARADLSRHYTTVLRSEVKLPLVSLPYVFERSFGIRAIEQVAAAIEAAL